MTSYHGGKQRIGRQLAQIIIHESIKLADDKAFNIEGYCEPFCGMLGVYQHIPELYQREDFTKLKYKAGDTNNNVIMMWKAAQDGWIPPMVVTEIQYNELKNDPHDSAEKCYIGHQYGFGGKFFKGYAPNYGKSQDSTTASNRVVKIANKLKNVEFENGSYTQFSDLKNWVIYCDPPYSSTEQHYKAKFDNTAFHDWCRMMAKNNIVFISEYNAPKDFKQVWSKTSKLTGVSKSEGEHKSKIRIEKLFIL